MTILPLHIEIDKIDRKSWEKLLTQFHDTSLSQVWTNRTSARRKENVSHMVIKAGEEVLGCCQVKLRHSPFYKIGIAHIRRGPLYKKRGKEVSNEVLLHLVRGIKAEYGGKRGYLIRFEPATKGNEKAVFKQILEDEGFKCNLSERPYRTLFLDLSPSLDEIRKNLLQKWRNGLNKAERMGLTIIQGTSDELYRKFLIIAHKMVERKNLPRKHLDAYEEYRRMQVTLPEQFKMQIMICKAGDEPICANVFSAVGDTGVWTFGATDEKALKVNGSYLLQWRMIQWMKERGLAYYDLGAFNPKRNPGGYHFKLGVAGKKGWEQTFLNEYRGCFNLTGRMAGYLLDFVKFLKGNAMKRDAKEE